MTVDHPKATAILDEGEEYLRWLKAIAEDYDSPGNGCEACFPSLAFSEAMSISFGTKGCHIEDIEQMYKSTWEACQQNPSCDIKADNGPSHPDDLGKEVGFWARFTSQAAEDGPPEFEANDRFTGTVTKEGILWHSISCHAFSHGRKLFEGSREHNQDGSLKSFSMTGAKQEMFCLGQTQDGTYQCSYGFPSCSLLLKDIKDPDNILKRVDFRLLLPVANSQDTEGSAQATSDVSRPNDH